MSLADTIVPPANWLLDEVGSERIRRSLKWAEKSLLARSLGKVADLKYSLDEDQREEILSVAEAAEIAALEWWEAARNPTTANAREQRSFASACSLGFTLLRALGVPGPGEERLSRVLRAIALGYLADRNTDVQRWLREERNALNQDLALAGWNGHLATTVLQCWIGLVRRNDWNEIADISVAIDSLREKQSKAEEGFLQDQRAVPRQAAWHLIGFYHWARSTELLAKYLLKGHPNDIAPQLDFHYERAAGAADASGALEFGTVLRWLHLASHRLVRNSVWNVAERFNTNISKYVQHLTSSSASTVELLPPQRSAIFDHHLLDRTHNAVVVSLPTSSGKTHLAIFRILEAINHFGPEGWVAYTAPTRALVNQIAARLSRELSGIGLVVIKLSGAVDVDQLEEDLLHSSGQAFHVLVATPEKLDVVIRQKKIERDLVLVVMDEAHSIEQPERGLKHELLLSMIKRDAPKAKFLLLAPFVENTEEIARWLDPHSPGSVKLGFAWQPNDRIIGAFSAARGDNPRNWRMHFRSLASSSPVLQFDGDVAVGDEGRVHASYSQVKNALSKMCVSMALGFRHRGTSLVITQKKPDAWSAADEAAKALPERAPDPETRVVQRFLAAEYGDDFALIGLLNRGVAVHHSGLSDEARFLVERLTEGSSVDVLCATTTLAQGINFPVASIFIASWKYPYGKPMSYREFWNLAGRAGRVGQPGVGVIGIAEREGDAIEGDSDVESYLRGAHGDLLSSLLTLYQNVTASGQAFSLKLVWNDASWSAFFQYLAHLFRQSDRDDALTKQLELTLRDTYGYIALSQRDPDGARRFLDAVREYVQYLYRHPENAALAEGTGFSPHNASRALREVRGEKIPDEHWAPAQLLGQRTSTLRKLMGVMLRIPEIDRLKEISASGVDHKLLARMTKDWVAGQSPQNLAKKYFANADTKGLTKCCDAIYGNLINNATWGLASLQKLSGLDFDAMSEDERRAINVLPAMVYYGVNTEDAVLMRMNGVPRSLAPSAGRAFARARGKGRRTPMDARAWLAGLDEGAWGRLRPAGFPMSGSDCAKVWRMLDGRE